MKDLQNFYDLLKWSGSKEADAIFNKYPHHYTTFEKVLGIFCLLMFFAMIFGICFAFKILVYNKIARAIKAKRRALAS